MTKVIGAKAIAAFAFLAAFGLVVTPAMADHNPAVVDYETGQCGETTFTATITDSEGTHVVNNMYLVVDTEDGDVQSEIIPVNGDSASITVGPFTSETEVISWRVWGGGERDYDQPLWNGYGDASFGSDIADYGDENGFGWVTSGTDDENPFTAWNEVEVSGCPIESDIDVRNYNRAIVINETDADANTGGNWAGGSEGGNGGNGGDIENDGYDGEQDVEDSSTGNGGRGGDGSRGGLVNSGNATAGAGTINSVNENVTRINRCACNGDGGGDDDVRNRNRAFLYNETDSDANSGWNGADGSEGGDGGDGGEIENDGGDDQDVDKTGTGNGGNAGSGGLGGTVVSGHAESYADTLNRVNRNTTRIRR